MLAASNVTVMENPKVNLVERANLPERLAGHGALVHHDASYSVPVRQALRGAEQAGETHGG